MNKFNKFRTIFLIVVSVGIFVGCGQNSDNITQIDDDGLSNASTGLISENENTVSPNEQQNSQLIENDGSQNVQTNPYIDESLGGIINVEETTGQLVPNMPDVTVPVVNEVTYLDFLQFMSAEEQAAFINSFESYDAFFAWKKVAYEEYLNSLDVIDGTTPIDLGKTD